MWKRRLNSVRDGHDDSDDGEEKKKKPIIWKTKTREAAKSVASQKPVESNSEHIHKSVDYLKELRVKRE